MRRKLIILSVVCVVTAALMVSTTLSAVRHSEALEAERAALEDAVRRGDWAQAEALLDAMRGSWPGKVSTLQVWMSHRDTDDVLISLGALQVAIESRLEPEALCALMDLQRAVEYIRILNGLEWAVLL